MDVIHVEPAHSDERGTISDLISGEEIEHATIIFSRKGAIRGNHYHKQTTQYLYILSGSIRCVCQHIDGGPIEFEASGGDLLINYPDEAHAFEALEDTTWLVLTHGPRGGKDYEKDTYRLSKPLIEAQLQEV